MGVLICRPGIAAALLLLVRLLSPAHAVMKLYFNNRSVGATFSSTQRCYTITHRWDDRNVNAEWEGLPDSSEFVFYENAHCKGFTISRALYPNGSCNFQDTKLFKKVSAFMVSKYLIKADDDENVVLGSVSGAADTN